MARRDGAQARHLARQQRRLRILRAQPRRDSRLGDAQDGQRDGQEDRHADERRQRRAACPVAPAHAAHVATARWGCRPRHPVRRATIHRRSAGMRSTSDGPNSQVICTVEVGPSGSSSRCTTTMNELTGDESVCPVAVHHDDGEDHVDEEVEALPVPAQAPHRPAVGGQGQRQQQQGGECSERQEGVPAHGGDRIPVAVGGGDDEVQQGEREGPPAQIASQHQVPAPAEQRVQRRHRERPCQGAQRGDAEHHRRDLVEMLGGARLTRPRGPHVGEDADQGDGRQQPDRPDRERCEMGTTWHGATMGPCIVEALRTDP